MHSKTELETTTRAQDFIKVVETSIQKIPDDPQEIRKLIFKILSEFPDIKIEKDLVFSDKSLVILTEGNFKEG